MSSLQCSIPISVLISAPLNLPWGTNVQVLVIAYNAYGNSTVSLPGSGAIIATYPNCPILITENIDLKGPTTIYLSW